MDTDSSTDPRVYSGQDFLNFVEHGGMGTISIRFRGDRPYPSGSIRISDCEKQVELEIKASSHKSRENSLHKIDTLIFHLKEVRKSVAKTRPRSEGLYDD